MDKSRYKAALRNLPPPGGGCHTAILGVANLGVKVGLASRQIFTDIRDAIPEGSGEFQAGKFRTSFDSSR